MKKLFLLPALVAGGILCAQSTYVTPWQDISTFSNSSATQHGGSCMVINTSTGDIFTVGTFEGSISIGAFNLTSSGDRDIYVAKYSSSGSILKAVSLGSAGFDDGYTITYKDSYVFVGAIVAGSGTIYKLDDDASPLDVVITRDLGADVRPRSLYAYGTSRILVGGSFIYSCSLPKSSGTINLTGSNVGSCGDCYDSFAGIIDMSAYFTFAGNPNSSTASNEIMSIWGRNGYIYCTGYFQDVMQWDAGGTTMTAAGVQDAFMASVYVSTSVNQINFFNDPMQAGSAESAPSPGQAYDDAGWRECGYGICANGTAIYVTGCLNNASTPLFDGTAYTGSGAFTARIDYNGSTMGTVNWFRTAEICSSSSGSLNSIGYAVAVDAVGNVFATGRLDDDVQLQGGGNADICVWTVGGRPGFLAKYEADGDILSADAINQDVHTYSSNWTEGRSIAINGCQVYTTGWTQTSETFQAGNLAPETVGTSKCAMYIYEIERDAIISDDLIYCEACASFPNTLSLSASGGTSYSWSPGTYLSSTTSATPTYSLTSCSNSGTTNYVCTITNTVTGCNATASVSVTAGSLAAANAGSDITVCPSSSSTIGTTAIAGLTYSWSPSSFLNSTTVAQPQYFNVNALGSPLTYTVTVTDVCGNTATDQVTLTNRVGCPHRVADPSLAATEVYPNPSYGVFTLNLSTTEQESNVEFVVTDLSGRVVQQSMVATSGGPVELDLSAEAKGVYILTVTREGVTETHKLVVE